MRKGIPAITEMSELTAEIEKISPLKPVYVEATFFSDRNGRLAQIQIVHNYTPIKKNRVRVVKPWYVTSRTYRASAFVYKTTTKEKVIGQIKKEMEQWKKQPRFQEA